MAARAIGNWYFLKQSIIFISSDLIFRFIPAYVNRRIRQYPPGTAFFAKINGEWHVGRGVRQGSAKPCTRVRISYVPPLLSCGRVAELVYAVDLKSAA